MKYYFIALFSLLSMLGSAQQKKIDSLLKLYSTEKVDTLRAKLLDKIASIYTETDPAKAKDYAAMGLELSKHISFQKGIATFMLSIGNAYSYMGNYEKALLYIDSGLAIAKTHHLRKNIAVLLNTRANVYQQQGNPKLAMETYFEVLKMAEEMNDTATKGMANFNIGGVYHGQNDIEKAKLYHEKGLYYFELENRRDRMAIGYTAVGSDYAFLKEYSLAIKNYEKAIVLAKELGNNRQLATIYDFLGHMYNKRMDPEKALTYILPASKIWKEVAPDCQNAMINLGNLGAVYLDIALNDSIMHSKYKMNPENEKQLLLTKAQPYLERAIELCKKKSDKAYESIYTNGLADLLAAKGDYKNAFTYYKKADMLDDSIHSQDLKNEIAGVEGKYKLSIKDKEIEISNLALAVQKKQRMGLLACVALFGLMGGLFYWQSITRKKNNTVLVKLNTKLDEANKVKAKFFGIISHDLRSPVSNLINFLHLQKEEPGLLSPQQAALHEKKIADSAESLLETMEGMLLWSKSQMENFKPDVRSIPVNELFEYIQKQVAVNTSIKINFDFAPGLMIHSDPNYLQSIMQNLTTNSIKAIDQSPNGKIIWKAWQKGEERFLSITDNGPGTNEEQVKALYDETTVTGTKHGLGLHIIRDLAKAIQCKISIQSQPLLGTTFTLAI